jgi:SET domain
MVATVHSLRMPLPEGLKVIRSNIHGYGVIATRSFAKGERLLVGEGIVYDEDADFDDTYALVFDGDIMQPPTDASVFYDLVCQARWINHSCDPNTQVDSSWDHALAHPVAWWTAQRDIAVGEELTYDYAFAPEVAEPCGCGAALCRGVIVDADCVDQIPVALRDHLRSR